jgi:hypothetical protein
VSNITASTSPLGEDVDEAVEVCTLAAGKKYLSISLT